MTNSMTTDIAGIRERANANKDMADLRYRLAALNEKGNGALSHAYAVKTEIEIERHPVTDVLTLLDANAELAERVRTLEAALRPFAEVWAFYGSRIDNFESLAHALFIRGWDDGFMLDADFKQAADALAATDANGESADHGGNGGA